jgi:hypothetical protein
LLILAGVLIVAAFIGGVFAGRASVAAAPENPPTGTAEDSAAQEALDAAKKKADEVMHESDADIVARVQRLRERGRAGE